MDRHASQPDPIAALRRHGLRATAPRLEVYRLLAGDGHLSAEQLFLAARERGRRKLPMATVYNALAALTRSGLVRAVDTGEGPTRYELRSRPHHHRVCRRCGALEDFEAPATTRRLAAAEGDFRIEEVVIQLIGLCAACAEATSGDHESPTS